MKLAFYLIVLFLSIPLQAQTKTKIERINFFPDADAFILFRYGHEILKIGTPQRSVMAKEVKNYKNLMALTYAHRISRKMFLGLTGFVEEASENAVLYGIPLKRRFNSVGLKEPEFFFIYRLKHQKKDEGLIDLFMALSTKKEAREIGNKHATRWNGRNILRTGLSHGMWEEEWEFRTSLDYIYYGAGNEKNGFTDEEYDLENYNEFAFNFLSQYRLNRWTFIFGSVGVEYHSAQDFNQRQGDEREIQAGTGSVFQLGLKRPLGDWSSIGVSYTLKRNDYFVKGAANNLEGDLRDEIFDLSFVQAF